jgi:hypothetical protein
VYPECIVSCAYRSILSHIQDERYALNRRNLRRNVIIILQSNVEDHLITYFATMIRSIYFLALAVAALGEFCYYRKLKAKFKFDP